MNNIYIVYRWEVPDSYTIEDEYLEEEKAAIIAEKEITFAQINGETVKNIAFLSWDNIQKEYITRHNLKIDADTQKIIIKRSQWASLPYTSNSIHDKNVKTWMIPSIKGSCLIFENAHFHIVAG